MSRLYSLRFALLALIALLTGLAGVGASGVGVDNAVEIWFVDDDPTLQAYQRFQQLAIKQQLAQEQVMTAEMNQDAMMNWGLWGPFWW